MQLIQKRFLKPTQWVTIEDGCLDVRFKRLLSERQYRHPLSDVSLRSSHQKSFSKARVAVSLFFAAFTLVSLVAGLTATRADLKSGFLMSAGLLAVAFLFSVALVWFTRIDIVAYFHARTDETLVTFYTDNPDKETFDRFISALHNAVDRSRNGEERMRPDFGDDIFSKN